MESRYDSIIAVDSHFLSRQELLAGLRESELFRSVEGAESVRDAIARGSPELLTGSR